MKKLKELIPWKRRSLSSDNSSENPVVNFGRHTDDLWNRTWYPDMFGDEGFFGDHNWYPKMDVTEGKKNITVEAEIPGVDSKDINVSLDGRILTIKGEKKYEKEDRNGGYYHCERSYGYFNRAIELPADVDDEKVDAEFKKGILKIKLKKTKETETKRIKVRAA